MVPDFFSKGYKGTNRYKIGEIGSYAFSSPNRVLRTEGGNLFEAELTSSLQVPWDFPVV